MELLDFSSHLPVISATPEPNNKVDGREDTHQNVWFKPSPSSDQGPSGAGSDDASEYAKEENLGDRTRREFAYMCASCLTIVLSLSGCMGNHVFVPYPAKPNR